MSKRAVEFLEEWVSENMVKPVAGAPEGDDSEARLRAEECVIAAKEEGVDEMDDNDRRWARRVKAAAPVTKRSS